MITRFQKWALATTIATYLLILIGSLVRASGSGLGCPDWPTCFGKPYPPFTYEEFLQREIPSDFDKAEFHVSLAWIEYTNRLTGVIIGLLVIGTLAYALRDHRREPRILYPTLGAFITVLINGWMGSYVVESRLEPLVITAHLVLALVQVTLLLYATVAAFYPHGSLPPDQLPRERKLLGRGAFVVMLLVLVQAAFGADLRGQLENIEKENPQLERGDWIEHADWVDQVHRSFSWTILIGTAWLVWYAHKRTRHVYPLLLATQLAGLLVVLQIAAGIGLAYAALPPPLQPLHVLSATLTVGVMMVISLLAVRLPLAPAPQAAAAMPAAAENAPIR